MLRKILQIALCMASIGFVGSYADAKAGVPTVSSANTVAINAFPQWRDWRRNDRDRDWRDRRYNDRFRTEMRTQVVRRGWGVYRETYQIRYLPNGRTQTYLVNRVRIR